MYDNKTYKNEGKTRNKAASIGTFKFRDVSVSSIMSSESLKRRKITSCFLCLNEAGSSNYELLSHHDLLHGNSYNH